jgi:hypothetical protein
MQHEPDDVDAESEYNENNVIVWRRDNWIYEINSKTYTLEWFYDSRGELELTQIHIFSNDFNVPDYFIKVDKSGVGKGMHNEDITLDEIDKFYLQKKLDADLSHNQPSSRKLKI